MGILHTREYEDIIEELTDAILDIKDFYSFFEMNSDDWSSISEEERRECAKTLSDDIFYGLGEQLSIIVSDSTILFDREDNSIKVRSDNKVKSTIKL